MFKKILAGIAFLACANCAWAEAEVKFCETFDENFVPVNVNTSFSGLQVSAFTLFEQPIGRNQIVISLYQDDSTNGTQALLDRSTNDVNPRWDSYGVRNLLLPDYGNYTLSFELADGTPMATGSFTLTEPAPDEPVKEILPTEKVGTTLEELFNKYAPKN